MRVGSYLLFITADHENQYAEILKEKLKQIIQSNNENFVEILQTHEVEITNFVDFYKSMHVDGDEKLGIKFHCGPNYKPWRILAVIFRVVLLRRTGSKAT